MTTYLEDEALWRNKMISLLEAGKLSEIDATNLIVVLAEMGKSDQRSVRSHLSELILHILKATYQPKKASVSWLISILKQRKALEDAFDDSPSLRNVAVNSFEKCYETGRKFALKETGLSDGEIPESPNFDLDFAMTTTPSSLEHL